MTTEQVAPQAGVQGQEPTAAEESVIEAELPADKDTFERPYVEKVRTEAARYRTQLRDEQAFIEGLGGKEAVKNLVDATRSPEGVFRLFMEAGQALGLNQQQIESLIAGEGSGTGQRSPASLDDEGDSPVTRKELEEFMQGLRGEVASQRSSDLAVQGEKVIYDTLDALGLTSDEDRQMVIRLAEEFAPREGDPGEFDPEVISRAVRAGAEQYNRLGERLAQQYLDRKEQAAEAPGGLGGSAPGLQLPEEPKDTRHASKMMRELLSREE